MKNKLIPQKQSVVWYTNENIICKICTYSFYPKQSTAKSQKKLKCLTIFWVLNKKHYISMIYYIQNKTLIKFALFKF